MTAHTPIPLSDISLLILAGGRGSRMGGRDKGLMDVAGRPAVEHLLERLATHPGPTLISANRNLDRYRRYGFPVIEDTRENFQGPLAGMLAGLRAATTPWLLTLPVDAPLVDPGYPRRMAEAVAAADSRAGVASLNGRPEPVFALLHASLAPTLEAWLDSGRRAANRWLAETGAVEVDFSDTPQQFINLNVAQDQQLLRDYLPS